ncbi:transketolase [Microbacterium sp. LRZ72]|uniref:transketolase n=1 Tax=Microbacterium sp. LRZ72 TaxID=2942481 RepID=UPI0029B1C985|nr:transketolase [Microbacterium sp. LRZ72]MDX2376112.1 transketolase [Microbacterium sp. LRZ72]
MTKAATEAQCTPSELADIAHALRMRMMRMAAGKGEGYIAQGLGIADLLTVLYWRELRFDTTSLNDPKRDRFLLSTGHYSIALYAALAELGVLSEEETATYALNGSNLPMSTFDETPGVEITSGSLGHGLGQGVGMGLGLRLDESDADVYVEISDGELQEGSTWEAAMAGASFKLDNLWALVDCNGIQADGPMVLDIESVAEKWTAFGWNAAEVAGNDLVSIVDAFDRLRDRPGPKAIILRTTPGYGVPSLVSRERAHFVRVAEDEWSGLTQELEDNREQRR